MCSNAPHSENVVLTIVSFVAAELAPPVERQNRRCDSGGDQANESAGELGRRIDEPGVAVGSEQLQQLQGESTGQQERRHRDKMARVSRSEQECEDKKSSQMFQRLIGQFGSQPDRGQRRKVIKASVSQAAMAKYRCDIGI